MSHSYSAGRGEVVQRGGTVVRVPPRRDPAQSGQRDRALPIPDETQAAGL